MHSRMAKTGLKLPDSEGWQLAEIEAGIAELDSGQGVNHDKVSKWLKSWGKPGESRAPRQRARRDG
jgi:predicted transcriptional regulator